MMLESIRGRKSSREKILDAAAELVSEIGAGRLTLDAVAEKAGLSKGGLLYNFPTKETLLQAMIQRLIDEVSAEKEAIRGQIAPGPNQEARICTSALLRLSAGRTKDVACGMLAATAENPQLLEPLRHVLRETLNNLKTNSDDVDAAFLAWLAVEGLNSYEMHGISPFSGEDRERVIKAVERLLSKGMAK